MEGREGRITDIIYHNEQNGYTICAFETEEEQFTAVGHLPSCHKGRSYRLEGEFKIHPKYGEQFAFFRWEEVMPDSREGTIGLLSSGIIKGIGPKMARAIVERFGEDTLRIIEEDPGQLKKISGIGDRKAEAIGESYRRHREFAEVALFFQQYDIGSDQALRLYKEYGPATVDIVRTDPYQLIGDVSGIGFKKADAIARKLGIDREDEQRIASGIKFTLNHFVGEGHTCYPRQKLCEQAGQMLEVSRQLVEEQLTALAFAGEIHMEELDGRAMVYLYPYYMAEQSVVSHLRSLQQTEPEMLQTDVKGLIRQAEAESDVTYSQEQKDAIEGAVTNGVSVITGGPGTGKTTIIRGILHVLEQSGQKVAVAAPTGRAAKRITETTGHEASTIHRLLEYNFFEEESTLRFGRNEDNPLDAACVIVDEASMIDLLLMDGLVKALKPGTRLILVGDADQLPSVGAGNVLADIIDSEYIYDVRLREIFRQASESLIVVNAHRINRGEYPACNEEGKDFFLLRRATVPEMADTIMELCRTRLPEHYTNCDPVRDIQVLTPVRKGPLGCIELNRRLQQALNPPASEKEEKTFGEKLFREGDKVMQIRNNYEMRWKRAGDFSDGEGVFNGDLGFIDTIDQDAGIITVVFDEDKYAQYETAQLEELEVAYAVTVHKSQGSEFPIVIMPVSWFPPMLANRNLLYTAVTRGKEAVVLVGSQGRMEEMVDNDSIQHRYTGLARRLADLIAPMADRS